LFFSCSDAINLFYIQAVFNIIHSNYPVTLETAVQLAGIEVQLTTGNKNADVHKPGYLKDHLPQYLPRYLIAQKKPEELEALIASEHEKNKGKDKLNLQQKYLDIVRQYKIYGCTFFKAKFLPSESFFQQEFEGKVRFGINQNGVHIVDRKEMKIVQHPFHQITAWNSDKDLFYFEVKVEEKPKGGLFSNVMKRVEKKSYQYRSKQAELMNDLMCDWSEKLEENNLEKMYQDEKKKKKGKS